MNRSRNVIVSVIGLLCFASGGWAGLEWEAVRAEPEVAVGDTRAEAVFKFINTGDTPIKVLKTRSGCGCTTTQLEGDTFEPGASGQLKATFTFGGRVGRQAKQVVVRTDAPDNPVTTLTMSVDIPELVRIKPKLVYWKRDTPRKPQRITVKVVHDEPLIIAKAKVKHGPVTARVHEVEPGKLYEVEITPTGEEGRAVVELQTDVPKDDPMSFRVIARVIGGSAENMLNQHATDAMFFLDKPSKESPPATQPNSSEQE